MVEAQHGELEVGQRMARAQHVERAFDLLLARVDQGHESLERESVATHRFAERFDDGLRARLGRARRLGHRLAPPLQTNERQHGLACDRARAGELVVEGEQRQQVRTRRLGREQRGQEAVAIGCAHEIEHKTMRSLGRAVGLRHRG
jgi:hypothetical protein